MLKKYNKNKYMYNKNKNITRSRITIWNSIRTIETK